MPDQTSIEQTILNASYGIGNAMANNLALVSAGELPRDLDFIGWYQLNLSALTYQYQLADYTSTTTTTIYDRLNGYIGIPSGAQVDQRFQNPNIVVEVLVQPTDQAPIVQVPFSNVTGYTINWQTDIPSGQQKTYAQLLGNYFPNPIVWFDNGSYNTAGSEPTITYSGGQIQTVVFDWAIPQSGVIRL